MSSHDDIPKLSLVAQFDDLCRFSNSLVINNEDDILSLIKSCEENRLRWRATQRELEDTKKKMVVVEKENASISAHLKHMRHSYANEVQIKNRVMKENKALRAQLEKIRNLILEDPTSNLHTNAKERVLSCINLNRMETLEEIDSTEASLSGLDFDKSEEDELDSYKDRKRSSSKRKSGERKSTGSKKSIESHKSPKRNRNELNDLEDFETNMDVYDENDENDPNDPVGDHIHNKRDRSFSEPVRKSYEAAIKNPIKSDSIVPEGFNTNTNTNTQPKRFAYTASTPHFKVTSVTTLPRTYTPQSKLGEMICTNVDQRQHSFVQKKVFRPENCVPCGKRIGFCSTCYKCRECGVTCHIECKDKVPLPCVPFSTPGRSGQKMILIADFVPSNIRPMIPALIVHCCNEIERRGLDEIGIYRVCGSDKEVVELKDKILKSKSGMPAVTNVDVHVLCGVVKKFLLELDEPLITRVLWRDFVRASAQDNPDDERALILQAISELPTANRDTLSFLMTHLKRIAESQATKMNESSLAKIFGPSIVGNSSRDIPVSEIFSELKKQAQVMESLFKISQETYNSIISRTPTPYSMENKRLSVGTRLFGGAVVNKAPMTPIKSSTMPKQSSNSNFSLRPLF